MTKASRILTETILITAMLTIAVTGTAAQSLNSVEFITRQKQFIRQLFIEKSYFDSIAETKRLLTSLPGNNKISYYNFFIDANYFLGGQYKTVIHHQHAHSNEKNLRLPSQILLSYSYRAIGRTGEAGRILYGINYSGLVDDDQLFLFRARTAHLIKTSRYDLVMTEISNYRVIKHNQKLFMIMEQDIKRFSELSLKSETIAALMSAIVPGSGQAYSGRYLDGIISLAAISATIYGAYRLHQGGENSLAFTLGFFSGLFYAGNIYGAYNAASTANKKTEALYQSEMINKHCPEYNPFGHQDIQNTLRREGLLK